MSRSTTPYTNTSVQGHLTGNRTEHVKRVDNVQSSIESYLRAARVRLRLDVSSPSYRKYNKKAVLSQGGPRDATANFGTYRRLQRHRAVFAAIARFSN